MQKVVHRSIRGFADKLADKLHINQIHAGKQAMVNCIAGIEIWCRSHGHGLKYVLTTSTLAWYQNQTVAV